MRFSLRWLFGFVLFAAIGCASLVYASSLYSEVLGAVLGCFLACAIIGSIYGRGAGRAFYGGCAIAGCSYILCLYLPPSIPLPNNLADTAINRLFKVVNRELPAERQNGVWPEGTYHTGGGHYVGRPMWEPFAASARVLATFGATVLGGLAARLFYLHSGSGKS